MKKRYSLHYMMMAELVCALAILAMLTASFFYMSSAIKRSTTFLTTENYAIIVLDNTLERLKISRDITQKTAEQIFYDEYAKSPVSAGKKVIPFCEIRNGNIYLALRNGKEKPIVDIMVKR